VGLIITKANVKFWPFVGVPWHRDNLIEVEFDVLTRLLGGKPGSGSRLLLHGEGKFAAIGLERREVPGFAASVVFFVDPSERFREDAMAAEIEAIQQQAREHLRPKRPLEME
jgi:hypothetical protein